MDLVSVPPSGRAALDVLVDAYLAELAEFRDRPVGPTCAADYEYLPLYWSEPGRHPFTISCDGETTGFALVRQIEAGGGTLSQMSDFYVQPTQRRRGTARAAVETLWRLIPGDWELQVHVHNAAAMQFWPRAIAQHAAGAALRREVTEDDGRRIEYRFRIAAADSAPGAAC